MRARTADARGSAQLSPALLYLQEPLGKCASLLGVALEAGAKGTGGRHTTTGTDRLLHLTPWC